MMETKQAVILVVDDDQHNTRLLELQLKALGYSVKKAFSGAECLQQVGQQLPDLILLDIMMPDMDGFEVVQRLKQDQHTCNIPVIMITALDDRTTRMRALQLGAEEFLTKPVDRAELWVRVHNLLKLKEYQDFLADHNQRLEEQVTQRTQALLEAYKDTIYTMVRAAEFKDEETGHHVQRISYYCRELALALGMDQAFLDEIFYASPMHDIGKIAIPDAILLKPGKFDPDEWRIMKEHTVHGAEILAKGGSPYTNLGAVIALNHHERWDGSGYPHGLRGEAIPLAARIMQICDVYDALRSKRPYKSAMDHQQAIEIITRGDGRTEPGHFDPSVLKAFVSIADKFADIYAKFKDTAL